MEIINIDPHLNLAPSAAREGVKIESVGSCLISTKVVIHHSHTDTIVRIILQF